MKQLHALFATAALVAVSACSDAVPHDIANYKERCIKMNAAPIPEKDSDPHRGVKNVYACGVTEDQLVVDGEPVFPYPEGTIIVKEATRAGQGYPWLIATARKEGGVFRWDEYTRNFPDQEFLHILAGEDVCTSCHVDAAESSDWIFTIYRGP